MKHNDEAVSPIIGVILMVAITVILAAIIAGFVFTMADGIHKANVIDVSIHQPNSDTIEITYRGGYDTNNFDHATINVTDDNGDFVEVDNLTNVVGNSVKVTGEFAGSNRVIIVGTFNDNTMQVIADTHI